MSGVYATQQKMGTVIFGLVYRVCNYGIECYCATILYLLILPFFSLRTGAYEVVKQEHGLYLLIPFYSK